MRRVICGPEENPAVSGLLVVFIPCDQTVSHVASGRKALNKRGGMRIWTEKGTTPRRPSIAAFASPLNVWRVRLHGGEK